MSAIAAMVSAILTGLGWAAIVALGFLIHSMTVFALGFVFMGVGLVVTLVLIIVAAFRAESA